MTRTDARRTVATLRPDPVVRRVALLLAFALLGTVLAVCCCLDEDGHATGTAAAPATTQTTAQPTAQTAAQITARVTAGSGEGTADTAVVPAAARPAADDDGHSTPGDCSDEAVAPVGLESPTRPTAEHPPTATAAVAEPAGSTGVAPAAAVQASVRSAPSPHLFCVLRT